MSPIERLLLPKSLTLETDPELFALLRVLAPQQVSNIVMYALTGCGFWYCGFHMAALISGPLYCSVVLLSLALLKMGFTSAFRYLMISISCISVGVGSVYLGPDCYFWFWFLAMMAGTTFVTLEREKNLRRFCYGLNIFGLAVSLCVLFMGWVTPEPRPDQHAGMVIFGSLTVIYGGVLIVYMATRYYRETLQYRRQLESQTVSMLQQAKMSSLGEMAAGVAHEINNPLGIIVGKLEGLKKSVKAPPLDVERLDREYDKLMQVTVRVAKIVSSLMAYSRSSESDPFQNEKLEIIFEQTLQLCSEKLKASNVDVRLTGDQYFTLDCRPTQLIQVFSNLINNSFEAVQSLPEKWIEINSKVIGKDQVVISVTDSGKGIPKEIVDKIMQPFFTTKEIGKGTGMGLSVAKGIVEGHRGKIELDIQNPHTRFVITMPAHQPKSMSDQAPAKSMSVAS